MFGPYDPPRTARGKFLNCECRGKVKVSGYSDGPIPWPIKWHTRNSLILCGDLIHAVCRESKLAVAHHWGVSLKTVQKWRRALEVEPYTPGSQWLMRTTAQENATPRRMRRMSELARPAGRLPKSKEWRRKMSALVRVRIKLTGPIHPGRPLWTPTQDRLLGTAADSVIAERLGRSVDAVRSRRCSLGVPVHRHTGAQQWTPAEEKLLGTKPDDEIAEILGRGARGVQIHRQNLGIPAFEKAYPPWLGSEDALLGTMPDRELAKQLRRPLQSIQVRRHLKGIVNPAPVRQQWTKTDDELIGCMPDSDVARKLKRPVRSVQRRRASMGIPNPDPKRKFWSPDETKLLGTRPDKEIANRLNCSIRTVTTKRVKLGISAFL
ncbi:MAG TPA: hypothetical protein VIW67_02510 [Terriglobales bacterium]